MILCAALKIEIKEREESESRFVVLPCRRHGDGFSFLKEYGRPKDFWTAKVVEQGFITHQGDFLNRKDAYDHALRCGQLSVSTIWYKDDRKDNELYSEDLY